jgi:glycosyltransferase involved in cell wall biosynthesis
LVKKGLRAADCIFYTYWFDEAAMGIGLAKALYPDLRLVSRIHGYDLYEERYSPPYLPCRPAAFEVVDGVYADAEAGLAYLNKRYPDFSSHFDVELTGVRNPGFISSPSSDGVFRIASCSIIRPVKRLERLLEGFAAAARKRPHKRFEWHHFGNGESEKAKTDLQQSAQATLPVNASAFFPGYSTQQALMDFYRENPIDVFLNVSSSEGTPVSSMEAISCGIPIIATGVGGNCEIVTAQNGIILSPHPSADEIAEAIFKFIDDPVMADGKRKGSLVIWRSKYDADANYKAYVRRLISIREAGRIE